MWYDMIWYNAVWRVEYFLEYFDVIEYDLAWVGFCMLSYVNVVLWCDSISCNEMIYNRSVQIISCSIQLPFELALYVVIILILLLWFPYSLLVLLNHHSCTSKWRVRAVDWIGDTTILHSSLSSFSRLITISFSLLFSPLFSSFLVWSHSISFHSYAVF